MRKIIFIGAGGFSKTVLDSLQKSEYKLCGFIDENKTGTHLGLPIFGDSIDSIEHKEEYEYFVAIGNVKVRNKWNKRIKDAGVQMANIISDRAFISGSAEIGQGCFVGPFAIINSDAVIADNCIINQHAMISPSVYVGENSNICPFGMISGEVTIGDNGYIGSGAFIKSQVKVGECVTIGAGAVVLEDLESDVTVVGSPAKVVKRGAWSE